MSEKLGFGIIGGGMISRWHADSIKDIEDAYVLGVFDTNTENAEKFAKEYTCKVFSSVDEMLSSDEVDVVSICTPSGLHAEFAVKAANAGKHFVVEKPMAITKEQIEDIKEACEKNNVKGAVISQLRFTDAVQKAKKAIEEGRLGKIVLGDIYMKYFRSDEYYKSAGWRGTWAMDGGGALMNQGIHGIDILQYLVGKVKSVYANCKTLARDIEVEDTASLIVEYENGAMGVIQGTTSVSPGYPRLIEISGTKGSIALTEDAITRWDIEGEEMELGSIADATNFKDPSGFTNDNHKMQIADLVSAIKENRKPVVDIYEGEKAVQIILSAYQSSNEERKVYIG